VDREDYHIIMAGMQSMFQSYSSKLMSPLWSWSGNGAEMRVVNKTLKPGSQ